MRKIFLISLFSSFILLVSCNQQKKLFNQQPKPITTENVSDFNGTYDNLSDSCFSCITKKRDTLFSQFKPHLKKKSIFSGINSEIKITILDSKHIQFDLYSNQKMIKTVEYKYKIKNGFLQLKGNYNLQGIPILFYRYRNLKLYFSLDEKKNLIVNLRGTTHGGLFFLIFGDDNYNDFVFNRK